MTQPIPMHVLCAYLPYGVKIHGYQSKLSAKIVSSWENGDADICLLLRPLSDLSKPLPELEGKTALQRLKELISVTDNSWPKVYLDREYKEGKPGIVIHEMHTNGGISIRCVPDYYMVPLDVFEIIREFLLSLHFDLFGGIQQGWGLDLNQENQQKTNEKA